MKWAKRIGIVVLASLIGLVLYYYFGIHLPMMEQGMHVQ